MSNFVINRTQIFCGPDFYRPRLVVEEEKLKEYYPQFSFYQHEEGLTIGGELLTNYGTIYRVSIGIPEEYPYRIPTIAVLAPQIDFNSPHQYNNGTICILDAGVWSSIYSLAYVVSRTALWFNKYENWRITGVWPGPSHPA